MLIQKITLKNYCQHHHFTKDIEGTLIAIIGPNGKGKSNLLGSLQFGLTGEQPDKKKSDLLSWGTDTGSVELKFQHNGTDAVLTRSLSSAGATLKFGNDQYSTASSVADGLKTHIGIDKDLAKQAVFVRQSEIDSILFTDPRVRELSFQRLLGIGEATKIHKALGEILGETQLPQNYDEQIAQGTQRYAELCGRLESLKDQLAKIRQARSQGPTIDTLKTEIDSTRLNIKMTENVLRHANTSKEADEAFNRANIELDTLPAIPGDLQELDAEIQDLTVRQGQAQAYRNAYATWQAAGEAMLALGDSKYSPDQLQAAKAAYEACTGEINRLLGRHKLHQDMLAALKGAGGLKECPVCGGPVEDINKLQDRLQGILKELSSQGAAFRAEQAKASSEVTAIDAAINQYQRELTRRSGAFQAAERALKATTEINDDAMVLAGQLEGARARRQSLLAYISHRTAIIGSIDARKSQAAKARSEFLGVEASFKEMWGVDLAGVTDQYMAERAAKIEALASLQGEVLKQDMEIAKLDGMSGELNRTTKELDNTITTLQAKRAGQTGLIKKIETLTRVRDWFHYTNGPHTLSASVLRDLTGEVNNFLGQFTAPFIVEASEEALGFKVQFTDGRAMPSSGMPDATVLSGGEKIQLAVAFRFATYVMFAGKLGLLTLDEPLNYLDSSNVARFGALLEKVKRVAQGMNLQIWLSTHDLSIVPFCDTVIDLTPK